MTGDPGVGNPGVGNPNSGDPGAGDSPQFLSAETCRTIIAQVRALVQSRARTQLGITSGWYGSVRWARNMPHQAEDSRWNTMGILCALPNGQAGVTTSQFDAASLQAAVQWAEHALQFLESDAAPWPATLPPTPESYPRTHIWSDATYTQLPEARSAIAAQLVDGAVQAGMLSAGWLFVGAQGVSLECADGQILYAPKTDAFCSMTVRDPQGTGSGWAGTSSYAWERIDAQKLAAIALDKCLRSRNPVAIEPGRYTTILEPQAAFDLFNVMMNNPVPDYMSRSDNEFPDGSILLPFKSRRTEKVTTGWKGGTTTIGFSRLGERVLDERLSITYDPLDPDLGVLPFLGFGFNLPSDPVVPVTWFDHGVLTTLHMSRREARENYRLPEGAPNTGAFRVTGGTDAMDDMIASTARGLVVTRFWGVTLIDPPSMLCTGVTRDGLWLIEKGKITKAVKNLRFTESPMFAFNQVEQLGVAIPIYNPGTPAVVPTMKVRDFSFTALTDAV